MYVIAEDFRHNLANLLARQGRGAKGDLARYLEVAPSFVTQLIKGDVTPSLERVEQIANYFQVTPWRLLKNSDKIAS